LWTQYTASLLMACLLLVGCGEGGASGSGTGGTAMIDLEQVAEEIGWSELIERQFNEQEEQVRSRLMNMQAQLSNEIEELVKAVGDEPTPEQRARIVQRQREAEIRFRQEVFRTDQERAEAREGLLMMFREQVRPVADRVARLQGYGMVVVRHDGILSYRHEVDITRAVIAEMKSSGLTAPASLPRPSESGSTPMMPGPTSPGPSSPITPLLPLQPPANPGG